MKPVEYANVANSSTKDVSERAYEDAVEAILNSVGWSSADTSDYDRSLAVKLDSTIAFIEQSQPKEWGKVLSFYGSEASARANFAKQLDKNLNFNGLVHVLRHGFKMSGARLRLCYFRPPNNLNADAFRQHACNRFEVVRQLRYGTMKGDADNSLDVVLFVNGLPLVTVELKNRQTGQSVENAMAQYRQDRDPRELIFRPDNRSLVHFAVDGHLVRMTTMLRAGGTKFWKFDKGNNGDAGNPPVEQGRRTDYLFAEVLEPQSLLQIVQSFAQVKRAGDKVDSVIFPRYHQLRVVRKLVASAAAEGPGRNYLIQHSAGSGKSHSISWTAHQLAGLTKSDGSAVFDSIVILTDRKVLDSQLQEDVYSMEHKEGLVVKVEGTSKDLRDALNGGARIIISTIQKFPYIYRDTDVADRTFAVIVDEAHSSQTGKNAEKTREGLSKLTDEEFQQMLEEAAILDEAAATEAEAAQVSVLQEVSSQGRRDNLSFIAFTATPKAKTLELFGTMGEDGKPHPFDLYSMRQAINEGYILDVLKNYTTFETYYKLVKSIPDDPKYAQAQASKALMNFVKLHPSNISKKAQIMVEHFRSTVAHMLDGKAKAMVVTSTRKAAVLYTQAFQAYIDEKGYSDMGVMVAFSGKLDVDGFEYTEAGMNGVPETKTAETFAKPEYQVMIVANKFQTGFDQPLLCAMYVDKILTGISAVQTLSRLNRCYPGKQEVFVLDFVNDAETIKKSFDDYYTTTEIDRVSDPNALYEIESRLEGYRVYTPQDVETLTDFWFGSPRSDDDNAKLQVMLSPSVERYCALEDERQYEFRELAKKLVRSYTFITQMVRLMDTELHRTVAFLSHLIKELPKPGGIERVFLEDEVDLESVVIEDLGQQSIMLEGPGELHNGSGGAGIAREDPKESLSVLIERFNARFGTDFGPSTEGTLSGMDGVLDADKDLELKFKNNSLEDLRLAWNDVFDNVAMAVMQENMDFFEVVGMNKEAYEMLKEEMLLRYLSRHSKG